MEESEGASVGEHNGPGIGGPSSTGQIRSGPVYYRTYADYKRARSNEGGEAAGHRRADWGNPNKRFRNDRGRWGGGYRNVVSPVPPSEYQPCMMSFKSFLSSHEDNISDEEAVSLYTKYKLEFKRQHLDEFFVSHKEEEWLWEKYHPLGKRIRREKKMQNVRRRLELFWEVMPRLEGVKVEAGEEEQLIKLLDTVVARLEEGEIKPVVASADKLSEIIQPTGCATLDEIAEVTEVEGGEGVNVEENIEEDILNNIGEDVLHNIREEIQNDIQESLLEDVAEDDRGEEAKDNTMEEEDNVLQHGNYYIQNVQGKGGEVVRELKYVEDDLELSGDDELEEVSSELDPRQGEQSGEDELEEISSELDPRQGEHGGEDELEEVSSELDPRRGVHSGEDELEEVSSELDPRRGEMLLSSHHIAQLDGLEEELLVTSGKTEQTELAELTPRQSAQAELTAAALHLPLVMSKPVSIHLKAVPPFLTRTQLQDLVSKYPGYLRLALTDPDPSKQWARRGWVTFTHGTRVKEICLQLGQERLWEGWDLGPVINRDLSRRVRQVSGVAHHIEVVRSHLRLAADLVTSLDRRWGLNVGGDGLNKNPLLENLAKYLVKEDELLGVDRIEEELVEVIRDEELVRVLDKLVMYLRIVHSVDFYHGKHYSQEDEMPSRLGLLHARGVLPGHKVTMEEVEQYRQKLGGMMAGLLKQDENLSTEEVLQLGGKVEQDEVDKYVTANTRELGKDKWLCPMSGKKFKGAEFVKKHILSKFSDKVEEIKQAVQFFNSYLADPKRPELPALPKVQSTGGGGEEEEQQVGVRDMSGRGRGVWGVWGGFAERSRRRSGGRNRGRVRDRLGFRGRGMEQRKLDPRAMVDYSDVDLAMDW